MHPAVDDGVDVDLGAVDLMRKPGLGFVSIDQDSVNRIVNFHCRFSLRFLNKC